MSRTLDVRNPRTGANDYRIDAADADQVAAVAARLRQGQPGWAALGFEGRAAVLARWADAIEAGRQPIIDALVADTGRLTMSRNEVDGLPRKLRRWGETAGAMLDLTETRSQLAPDVAFRPQYVPYQLAGMISPWNFPLTLAMIDALPALAAGCAVIVKPSEVTPRFAAPFRATIDAVPALAAVFAVVDGDGATGRAVIDAVDMICFTGSVPTGRKVAEAAARRFIPAFLELGGKDPAVVLKSADLDRATDAVLRQAVVNNGQVCLSIERVYVDEAVVEPFVELLVEKAERVETNAAGLAEGHLGPIISGAQAGILRRHLDEAVAGGATIRSGGTIEGEGGAWLRPTVLTGVTHAMAIMRDESFGPLIPVMPFADVEEAVALANDSDFGLSAAVFAGSEEEALAVAARIDAGAVSINDAGIQSMTTEAEKMSFKYSGLGGSRMGPAGMLRFFRKKALMIQRGTPRSIEQFREAS